MDNFHVFVKEMLTTPPSRMLFYIHSELTKRRRINTINEDLNSPLEGGNQDVRVSRNR